MSCMAEPSGCDRTADHFGSIPGSLLAWWLLERAVNVRTVLEWSAVPGAVAVVVLWFALRPGADRADRGWTGRTRRVGRTRRTEADKADRGGQGGQGGRGG